MQQTDQQKLPTSEFPNAPLFTIGQMLQLIVVKGVAAIYLVILPGESLVSTCREEALES